MGYYGILGSGSCGENIIEDGLRELGVENNVFLTVLRRGASDNEDRVYDFLIDNEADFHVFTDSRGPQAVKDAASRIHEVADNEVMFPHLLKELQKHKGTLLMLWNEETASALMDICLDAADMGIPIKELTNGLAPIQVSDAEETPITEAEVEPFSEAELRSMSIGILRKAARAQGIENPDNYTKDELLGMLTDSKTHTERLDEMPTSLTGSTANVTFKSSQEGRPNMEAPDGDCMVVVVMPNGTVVSTPATIEEVRVLLGLGGGS